MISCQQFRQQPPSASPLDPASEHVKCECCGLSEECTPAYIAQVRSRHCGKWVCGLCSEAVQEELARKLQHRASMEEALRRHMGVCLQFSSGREEPETLSKASPVADIALAMKRLLRRSVDGSASPRSAPSTPRGSSVARTRSCSLSPFTMPPRTGFEAPL